MTDFKNTINDPTITYSSNVLNVSVVDSSGDIVFTGIAKGEYNPTLSDTDDLIKFGWLEAITAGTVKYTTFYNEVRTRTVDAGWISLGIVRRVWLTDTSASIVVHYE